MSKYFAQTKYPSFIRQVNGWGFRRITQGADQNSYYHDFFLRTKDHLLKFMTRHTAGRQGTDPEPNLHAYPFLPPNPHPVEDLTTQQSDCMHKAGLSDRPRHDLPMNRATTSFSDGPNDLQWDSAAQVTNAETSNGTQPANCPSQVHSQWRPESSHQGNQYNNNWHHQYYWNAHSYTQFEQGHQQAGSTSVSAQDNLHSARSTAVAARDYNENSVSLCSHDGHSYHGQYDDAAVRDHQENSASLHSHRGYSHYGYNGQYVHSHQTRSEASQFSYQGNFLRAHQISQVSSGDTFHSHQVNGANSENTLNQPSLNRGLQGRSQHHDYAQPDGQLSSPTFRSESTPENNERAEEPNVNAGAHSSNHHDSEPMSRSSSPLGEYWDHGLAAKLSHQLEKGS